MEAVMSHTFTPVILLHAGAAIAALLLGFAVFLRRKGDFNHRLLGRAWVGLMLVAALSSFWIKGSGSFSWIHGLSVLTLVLLTRGVMLAVRGDIRQHRKVMFGTFCGALVIAGFFSLVPGRLMGHALWSALGVI
jgi:uncharacterized membrane protein